MAENPYEKKPPPKNWLIHEGCGGTFVFLKKDPDINPQIEDERVCTKCHLKETYEPDRLIIIAKPGISEEEFTEFLLGLIKNILGLDKIKSDKISDLVKITPDKNNPQIFAADFFCHGAEKSVDSERIELLSNNSEEFNKIVSAVCRKPKPMPADEKRPEEKRKL